MKTNNQNKMSSINLGPTEKIGKSANVQVLERQFRSLFRILEAVLTKKNRKYKIKKRNKNLGPLNKYRKYFEKDVADGYLSNHARYILCMFERKKEVLLDFDSMMEGELGQIKEKVKFGDGGDVVIEDIHLDLSGIYNIACKLRDDIEEQNSMGAIRDSELDRYEELGYPDYILLNLYKTIGASLKVLIEDYNEVEYDKDYKSITKIINQLSEELGIKDKAGASNPLFGGDNPLNKLLDTMKGSFNLPNELGSQIDINSLISSVTNLVTSPSIQQTFNKFAQDTKECKGGLQETMNAILSEDFRNGIMKGIQESGMDKILPMGGPIGDLDSSSAPSLPTISEESSNTTTTSSEETSSKVSTSKEEMGSLEDTNCSNGICSVGGGPEPSEGPTPSQESIDE